MSLCIVRSIRRACCENGERVLRNLNVELKSRGLREIVDSDPDALGLRKLPCGSVGASTLCRLVELCEAARVGASFIRWSERPYTIAIPLEFDGAISVMAGRMFYILPMKQLFVSLCPIYEDLIAIASVLRIPLENGELDPNLAERLADCRGLSDEEEEGFLENERSAWLDLYLAAKYCMEDGAPFTLR